MPLDSTGQFVTTDPLTRLGITPVPFHFVAEYKVDYRSAWLRNHPDRGPGPFRWNSVGYQEWKQAKLSYALRVGDRRKQALTLGDFLARPFANMYGRWDDKTAAPPTLVNLANLVQREIPDAEFSVDYFDVDPVLNVWYSCDGHEKRECLGIWEHGMVKVIADHPPIAEPIATGFLANLRRWWQTGHL